MRINCHAHVFNLRLVATPTTIQLVRDRLLQEIEPPWLAKAAVRVAEEVIGGVVDLREENLLRGLLDDLAGDDAVRGLVERVPGLPEELGAVLERRLERVSLRFLRRAVTGVVGVLRGSDREDFERGDLFDMIETLRIGTQNDVRAVGDWLMRQVPTDAAVVPLMLDITGGVDADPEIDDVLFVEQWQDTSKLTLAYPGRVLPFVFVHPKRVAPLTTPIADPLPGTNATYLEVLERSVASMGYIGVKLYPSFGYALDSDELAPVYALCESRGIPITVHTNPNGFVGTPGANQNPHPDRWRPILTRHPALKVCLAHFGGSGGLTQAEPGPDSWVPSILSLMDDFEGVYADLSFHRGPMQSPAMATAYFDNLERMLDHPRYGDRILFGTDFWLIRPRLSERNHWRFFEQHFARIDPSYFTRIADINARRFLGLPDRERGRAIENDAVEAYVRFVAANLDDIEGPIAPWLQAEIDRLDADLGAAARTRSERFLPHPSLRLAGWRARLHALATTSLRDVTEQHFEVERAWTPFAGHDITIEASAALRVTPFTDRSATDPDGILLPPPGTAPVVPQLMFQTGKAWLKYRLEGRLAIDAHQSFDAIGLSVNAAKTVVFTDYRCHRPDQPVARAIRDDLAQPRLALSREDVLRLESGEAVSVRMVGELAGQVTLRWSDVFSRALPALTDALGVAGAPLGLRMDMGASLTARVTLEDDFRVVFSRHEERFQVAVTKLDTRSASVQAAVVGRVQWSDPGALESMLGQLVTDHTPGIEIDEAKELRAELLGIVERVARARIEVGFTYEYRRVDRDSTLLVAKMGRRGMEELHSQLAQGDIAGLLDRHRLGDRDVDLLEYLRVRSTERRRAWGFSLGSVASQHDRSLRFVAQRRLSDSGTIDAVAMSFRGARGYQGSWLGGERWKYSIDLRAETREPGPPDALTVASFDYGLALAFDWAHEKLNRTELRSILDVAATWGAPTGLDVAGRSAVEAEIDEILDADVRFHLELVLDQDALRVLLPIPDDRELAARAMAMAMPFRRDSAHESPSARVAAYASLWSRVFERSSRAGWRLADHLDELALRARNTLRDKGFPPSTYTREDRGRSSNRWRGDLATFGGCLAQHPSVLAHWVDFQHGLGLLADGVSGSADHPPEAIRESYGAMARFWGQSHHVRAVGAYFAGQAVALGQPTLARAVLTIEPDDGVAIVL